MSELKYIYETVLLNEHMSLVPNEHVRGNTLKFYQGELPLSLKTPAWGIDPGVNFGVTFISGRRIHVYQGELNMERDPGCYAVRAYRFFMELGLAYSQMGATAVIEGAAFGKGFGQVKLGEVRTAFYLAAHHLSNVRRVEIVPPATIRARVFGKGKSKTQAGDIWPIDHNAADSLSMALCAAALAQEEE